MTDQPSHGPANPGQSLEPHDHIAKVRHLVWSLKESLSNLLKIAAQNIIYNSNVDSGVAIKQATLAVTKPGGDDDGPVPRLDKAMEDFYSIFNQIELHLKTIQECAIQQRQSQKYLPFTISNHKTDIGFIDPSGPDPSISYGQYIQTIKRQINYVDSIEKILLDGAKKTTPGE